MGENMQLTGGQIPSLTISQPPHMRRSRSLVKFHAMVQDTSRSPEMYLSSMSSPSGEPLCGGWGLENEHPPDVQAGALYDYDTEKLRERTVLWAVNIPGETSWCAQGVDPNWTPSTGMPSAILRRGFITANMRT